jgi:hypothetical protein
MMYFEIPQHRAGLSTSINNFSIICLHQWCIGMVYANQTTWQIHRIYLEAYHPEDH